MTQAQKIIKYCALALAFFIIGTLCYGVGTFFGSIFSSSQDKLPIETLVENVNLDNIDKLSIETKASNLSIKNGDVFKIETNNKYITYTTTENELIIKENDHSWKKGNQNLDIIIYIPNIDFKESKISTGAGNVEISSLKTKELSFDIGAGKVIIDNLDVESYAIIEGGAGQLEINSGVINNLDLDMGIGNTNISATILGNANIDSGVGNSIINIEGNKDDYSIKSSKGLGNISIDGEYQSDGSIYGTGSNTIKVSGGIGNISINFKKITW